jgi:hypothetical protein
MGNAKGFAACAVEEVAFQCLTRGEGDRMNKRIETIPLLAELIEETGNFVVALHVAGYTCVLPNSAAILVTRS